MNYAYKFLLAPLAQKSKRRTFRKGLLGLASAILLSASASAQVYINENFSAAVDSITPPPGWVNNDIANSTEVWRFDNPSSLTLNAPIAGTAAIFDSDWYGSGPGDTAALESPAFDASGANQVFLSFDHYFQGGFGGEYFIQVYNGSSWVSIDSGDVSTTNPASETYNISSEVVGVSTAQVRFLWKGDYSWNWIVDNVVVQNLNCSPVSNIASLNLLSDEVLMTWDTAGSATQWSVEYGAVGFTPGNGTMLLANNDTFNITGLTPATAYDVYVRSICGVNDTSIYAGPLTIQTACTPFPTTFTEDFTTFLPTCWGEAGAGSPMTSVQSLGSSDWVSDDFGNASGASQAARLNLYSDDDEEWLVSPLIDLTNGGPHNLLFDFAITDFGNTAASSMGSDDTVQVLISNDGGMTWTAIQTWDNSSVVDPAGEQYIFDLTAYDGDTIYVAFWGTDGTTDDSEDYDVFVDNVEISTIPSCPSQLSGLMATATSSSTVTVNIDTTGSGVDTFLVEYGPTGFTPGNGMYQITTADTAAIAGLMAGSTYDFYAYSLCTVNDTGYQSGPAFATTFFNAPYVEDFDGISTGAPANFGNGWTDVSTTSFDWHANSGTTSSTGTGPNSDHTSGSGNYMYTEATDGSAGDTAIMLSPMIDINSLANPYLSFWFHRFGEDYLTGYIDIWDGNSWVTIDSLVGEYQTANADPYIYREVDLAGYSGNVQFRFWHIKDDFEADWAIDDVEIFSKPNDDIGVVGFAGSENFCGDSNTVLQVIIENFGVNSQSGFDVNVDITGSAIINLSTTYTGTLNEGEMDTIIIDTLNTSAGGTFDLSSYTLLSGDANAGNDSTLLSNITFQPLVSGPSLTTAAMQMVCVGDSTTFSVASTAEATFWKDTNGSVVASGDNFNTGAVTANDTFYVNKASVSGVDSAGLQSNAGTGTFISQADGWGLGFTVTQTVSIDSVVVYPEDTGMMEIYIMDQSSNNIIFTGPMTAVSGPTSISSGNENPNTVPVGALLGPGTYKIGMNSTGITSLIRESGIGGFPYVSSTGAVEITGGSTGTGAPTSTSYYWFYNWDLTVYGCESAAEMVTVSVDQVEVDLGPDTAYCAENSLNLTLDAQNSGASYDWNTGVNSQTIFVDTAGTYAVEVTNANNCVGVDTVFVTENATPMVDLGSDTAYCSNESFSLTLDAMNSSAASYTWSTGESSQTIVADSAGSFSVLVTSNEGCEGLDTIEVVENAAPVVMLGGDTAYCSNEAIALTLDASNSGASYDWNTGDTTQTIVADTAGTYTVEVTSAEGCVDMDTLVVDENLAPSVDLGSDTAYCADESISLTLDAGNPGQAYLWQDGQMTQTITADSAGLYFVAVSTIEGCIDIDSLEIMEEAVPTASVADAEVCEGETATLDAGAGFASYLWLADNSTNQTLDVDSAGIYSVVVANAFGCDDSATAEVVVNPVPVVDLGEDTTITEGNVLTLDAGAGAADYLWSSGETTQTLDVDETGTYSVVVTNDDGCIGSDTINVEVIVGINERSIGSMSFYPNPTNGLANLKIDLQEGGNLEMEIYSINGQLVRTSNTAVSTGSDILPVDLQGLNSGMYLLNVKLDGESVTQIRVNKL